MAERQKTGASAGFLLLTVLLLGGATAGAQLPGQGLPVEEMAFNDWGARTFLIEVQPLVQKYTGWKREDLPAFRTVTRVKYLEAMAEESARFNPRFGAVPIRSAPGVNPMALAQIAGLLGRFSYLTKTIYLLPGNLKPVMHHLGVESRFTRDLVEIVCAHELTHAFQDERHPFSGLAGFPSEDAAEAYAMLTEGHAVFVQEQVAQELKLDEAAREMIDQMAFHEASDSANYGAAATRVTRRYTSGGKFVNAVYRKYGLAGVQRLFEHPPKSTAAVMDPEVYFATEDAGKATASTR